MMMLSCYNFGDANLSHYSCSNLFWWICW